MDPNVRAFVEDVLDVQLGTAPRGQSDVQLRDRLAELFAKEAIDLDQALEAFGIVQELRDRRDDDDWNMALNDIDGQAFNDGNG